jgi:hypothetical protein
MDAARSGNRHLTSSKAGASNNRSRYSLGGLPSSKGEDRGEGLPPRTLFKFEPDRVKSRSGKYGVS